MKRFSILWTLVFVSGFSFAQMTKDSVITTIAKEMCDKVKTLEIKGKTEDEITLALGMQMLPAFTKYEAELKEFYGFDIDNKEAAKKVGYDVGFKLVTICPEFMKLMIEAKSNIEKSDNIVKDEEVVPYQEISGVFTSFNQGDICSFIISMPNGKTEKIFWLQAFKDDALLKNASLLKGKKIIVSYQTMNVYNAARKKYEPVKVVAGIRL